MIVVAGGTGTLGTRLVPRLVARDLPVRVLTRDASRAQGLADGRYDVVQGDVRDRDSVTKALQGADVVISAVHGFVGSGGVTPDSVDKAGNANLIEAAVRNSASFVLVSGRGSSPDHPWELARAKYAAEESLRQSGIPWTIVRATAFTETWGGMMIGSLKNSGKILVFGRGNNPINFVSVTDVAALVDQAVSDANLRGRLLELGGPDNLTFNQLAAMVQEVTARRGAVRHVPRPVLRIMGLISGAFSPQLARQARAAVVLDTLDMSFDAEPARREFPNLPITDVRQALTSLHNRQTK